MSTTVTPEGTAAEMDTNIDIQNSPGSASTAVAADGSRSGTLGTVVIRVTLGVTTFFTWLGNVRDDFYSAEGLRGYFDWAFLPAEDGGNGSTLFFVRDILDATILQAPGAFGAVQTVVELAIAIGLIFGIFTRAAALGAIGFFFSLFLVQFGGEEWIWTYVLLVASAVAVFLNWGGRTLGVDQLIAKARGESPGGLIW